MTSDSIAIDTRDLDRVLRLGVDPHFVWATNYFSYNRSQPEFIAKEWMNGHTWSRARLKRALDILAADGVLIIIEQFKMGGYRVKWGPSAADMSSFFDMIFSGMKPSEARKTLVKNGVPDPGLEFWTNQAKGMLTSIADLRRTVDECTGPDGEVYGHR